MIARRSDGEQEIGGKNAPRPFGGRGAGGQRPRTSKPKPRATVQNEGVPGGD